MKILDEKVIPCEYCNPDGTDPKYTKWCDHCRGFGFVWLRTAQLDEPINMVSIELDFTF